jgi:hypothetical protein
MPHTTHLTRSALLEPEVQVVAENVFFSLQLVLSAQHFLFLYSILSLFTADLSIANMQLLCLPFKVQCKVSELTE